MGQRGLAQAGWAVEQGMVQRLVPAFGRPGGDIQIILNLVLADEIAKVAGPQIGVERYILGIGLTGYDAVYGLPSLSLPVVSISFVSRQVG